MISILISRGAGLIISETVGCGIGSGCEYELCPLLHLMGDIKIQPLLGKREVHLSDNTVEKTEVCGSYPTRFPANYFLL